MKDQTAFELGYSSEETGMMFKENPFPPKTKDHDDWIIGKCQAINDSTNRMKVTTFPRRAIIANADMVD